MRPILIVTDANFLSHLLRCVEIAKELRQRGYKVVFAASGRYTDLLERYGFERHPVFTNDPDHTMRATRNAMCRYYNTDLLKKSVESEVECIRKINPAVVLGDFRWTLKISTEYCCVPYVAIINTMWTMYYAIFRSISEKMLLRKIFGLKFMEKISPIGEKLMMFCRGTPFYKLRKKLKISSLRNLMEEMTGDYNLMPDIPDLCPTDNLPDNFEYIGPLFAKSETITCNKKISLPDGAYLYVTLGSTATPRMIKLAIDAFVDKNIPVVMTTGKQAVDFDLPNNFYVYDYLPSDIAFSNAIAVLCHGGQGTLYQALSYGKPIIGIATHNDQQWNMDRITDLKLGIQFGEDSAVPDEIYKAFLSVVNDSDYKANCDKMKTVLTKYDSISLAVDAIVRFYENKSQDAVKKSGMFV